MHKILCYTRKPLDEAIYAPRLAYSMHLAYDSADGYKPLNHNTGVLFVKATQNPDTNEIYPKSLKSPWVCPLPDGGFAVVAIRTEPNGEPDESSKGCAVVFKTDDLLNYTELGLVKLCDEHIDAVTAHVCHNCHKLVIKYKTSAGVYRVKMNSLTEPSDDVKPCHHMEEAYSGVCDIEGIVPANEFEVPDEIYDRLTKKLLTPVNTAISLDKTQVESVEELLTVGATAHYSDGSTARKRIDWVVPENLGAGEYTVHGTVHQDHFDFPFATNRADPCIYRYNGSYYFIATNDADWNHTLYVRKADSIPALKDAEEHLILDSDTYDHVKGLLWAPEFHEVDGKLYIFHACTTGEFADEQSHITAYNGKGDLTDKSAWEMPIKVQKPDGSPIYQQGITLDMTTFVSGGDNYVVWSQRQFSPIDLGAWLYIAKIDSKEPWKLICEPKVLSMPILGWQNNHTLVDEGPYALIRDGKVYLTFSSALVDSTYCVGLFTANLGDDLMDINNWHKTGYPLLSSASVEGEFGPGHNAYCIDEYGDIWNTYHARPGVDGPRSSGLRRVHIGFDGEPVLDMTEDKDVAPALKSVSITLKIK